MSGNLFTLVQTMDFFVQIWHFAAEESKISCVGIVVSKFNLHLIVV